MPILQWEGRVYLKGSLPPGFDIDDFAMKIHRHIHGVLIPSEGMTAKDISETEPPSVHIHVSTNYDACSHCIETAQDEEQ